MAANTRESQDMLARVSRTESETHNAYRKIEDHLRSLARRLDSAERLQTDNSRALNQAAHEISHASREQMQAFETLGTHVISLGERVDRIEHRVSTDPTRDVVRGLQDGLARMADQVAETANQSASQISVLATAMEAVVTKMSDAHKEAATTATLMTQRIGYLDDRVQAMETTLRVKGEATDRALQRLEERSAPEFEFSDRLLEGVEQRHAAIREEFMQNLKSLDTRYGARRAELQQAIEGVRTEQQEARNEVHRRIAELERRFSDDGEAERRAALEKLQQAIEETRASQNDVLGNVQSRIGELEEQFAAIAESSAQRAALEELQQTLDNARAAQKDALNEVHARISALESHLEAGGDTADDEQFNEQLHRLEDSIEQLSSRVSAQEVQSASALARLEDGFARIESQQDNGLDRRVYGVERSIQELMDRLEAAERHSLATTTSIEEQLRALSSKIDDVSRNTHDAITGLHRTVEDTSGRLEAIEGVAPSPAPVEDERQSAPGTPEPEEEAVELSADDEAVPAHETPQFDMPPFDEPVAAAFKDSAIHRAFGQRHKDAFTQPEPDHDDIFREERPLAADGFGTAREDEDFLSAARHSASQAAAVPEEPMATTLGGFTWGARRAEPELREERPRSRVLLIGGIALVAILAIGLGVMLSQQLGSHRILQTVPAAQTAPPPAKPAEAGSALAPSPSEPKPNTLVLPPQTKTAAPMPVSPKPDTSAGAGDRLTNLANGGNSKAQLLLGLKYLDGDGVTVNEAVAAKWLQRAADQGEPIAQYRLGTLYERGLGVATDTAKAVHLYEAAARQGNRKAMHNLAVAYAEGSGTAKNYSEAARWFGRAAALGLADSQFNLAVLYERGLGVPQSLTEAIAATQGDNESKARVAALATQLTPADHDAAQKAADTFRPEPINRAANVPPETPGRG